MTNPRATTGSARPAADRAFDWELAFLARLSGPLALVARAMLAAIFMIDGAGAIADYAGTADYMQSNGVDPRLLPLVISDRARRRAPRALRPETSAGRRSPFAAFVF